MNKDINKTINKQIFALENRILWLESESDNKPMSKGFLSEILHLQRKIERLENKALENLKKIK